MSLIISEEVEVNGRKITTLYLNNPQTKNSMTWEMSHEFRAEIEKIQSAKDKPSCIIITGKNHIFSSGGDLNLLKSFRDKSYDENCRDMFIFYSNFLSVRRLNIPVIAGVNGHAMGAAFSLALACDARVFSLTGKYSFNFVKLGIHPGMGSSYIVKELFGKDMANYLLLLGEAINGEEAKSLKLCYDAVSSEDVVKRSMEIAINISESAPQAISLLKQNTYDHSDLEKALRKEAESQAKCFQSSDFAESILAIEEKRKPFFTGN
ncbi:MAG: enoyl-CoA hydratase/isomerase family protein [Leptospiraceae bacterium]|nr:enoyl-CoA hydratase/isomerase family protein [Leptospiraceae bacterium]